MSCPSNHISSPRVNISLRAPTLGPPTVVPHSTFQAHLSQHRRTFRSRASRCPLPTVYIPPHSLRFPAIAFTPATHWQKTSDTSHLSVDFYLHNRCRTRLGYSRHDAGLYNGKAGRGLLLYELPQPLAQGGIRETNSR